jgi:translation initiation factor 1
VARALHRARFRHALTVSTMTSGDRLVYSTDNPDVRKEAREQGRKPAPCAPGRPVEQPGVVYVERSRKGRGGKTVTVISNVPGDEAELQALLKSLKTICGAGGTVKGGVLEVQGDHREKLAQHLAGLGFKVKMRGG